MIQIQITCEKPEELKNALEELLKQLSGSANQPQKVEPEKTNASHAQPEKADAAKEPATGNEPSIDVCRSVYFEAKKRGVSNDEIKKVLTSMGAEKISSIPENKRATFVEAVRAMGR